MSIAAPRLSFLFFIFLRVSECERVHSHLFGMHTYICEPKIFSALEKSEERGLRGAVCHLHMVSCAYRDPQQSHVKVRSPPICALLKQNLPLIRDWRKETCCVQ